MELIIIGVLLVIAAETTYLTYTLQRKNARMLQAPLFVDTSVLIDGRIVAIAESGFLSRPLYIPRSVVGELQFLADNADSDKRARARHGLDVITQLQAITKVKATIFNDGVRATDGVDNRLLELAKKHTGAVCTIDYNLNKVAVVEGVEVVNVNELAKSLRMAYLPGERTTIALTQKGNDSHQGVGHLDDGTMVVVEQAQKYIGKAVEVEFIRSLQTAAGKMMFAKLITTQGPAKKQPKVAKQKQRTEKRAEVSVDNAPVQAVESPKPAQSPGNSQKGRQPREVPNAQVERSEPAKQTPAKRTNQRRGRRTPEDSMVELANRS